MVDALASGPPVLAEHVEVLERLRQLTAWQQAQQERLRAQQQLQIARLRGCGQDAPSDQFTAQVCTAECSPRPQPQSLPPSNLLPTTTTPPQRWSSLQMMYSEDLGEIEEEDPLSSGAREERGGGLVGSDSGLETGGQGSEEETQQREEEGEEEGDRPIQPGVGEDDTFEDLLERQLRLDSEDKVSPPRKQHPPQKTHSFLRRGEGLVRFCGPQRRGQGSSRRRQNQACEETESQKIPDTKQSSHEMVTTATLPLGSRFSSDESFIVRGHQRHKQEEAELVEFEQLEMAAFNTSAFSQCSLVRDALGGASPPPQDQPVGSEGVRGDSVRGDETPQDLDKTLTPSQTVEVEEEEKEEVKGGASLADGLVFSDEEEWDSFRHPSPPPSQTQREESPLSSLPSPERGSDCVSSTPLSVSPTHHSPPPHPHSSQAPPPSSSISEAPPPPSALAAKLFPALRREREQVLQRHRQPQPSNEKTTPTAATPPRYPSEPEFREKLCQLESEIERFRYLNSHLEQQNREKEQSLSYLKNEMAEFQQQMRQEMEQFEQYKQQEMRKMRKERKVFETYVQECRAGLERKDREEIETLRNEVEELQAELASREERWRVALARQRQRVVALEGQNRELQGDLRMMERERLTWWQEQLEEREERCQSPPPVTDSQPSSKPQPTSTAPTSTSTAPLRAVSSTSRAASRPQVKTRRPLRQRMKRNSGDKERQTAAERVGERKRVRSAGVSGGREGGGVDEQPKTESSSKTVTCEIVEVISRDLSPPESDSEGAGSDVSAIAEGIVDRVMGTWMEGRSQEAESRKTAAEEVEKMGKAKTVRFALESSREREEGREKTTDAEEEEKEEEEEDGSKVIVCSNGTRKITSSDGRCVTLKFANGDTKHIQPDNTVVYYYSQSQTTHITHRDGTEEIHFPNHQTEKVFPGGRREVRFPDGTVKTVQASGEEESVFADGTVQRLLADGTREIHYTNGQKEIHTQSYKRREYPDGTVKTVFPDGRQETKYASGRLRVKDSTGNLLVDSFQQTNL